MHDAITVGIPVWAILFSTLWNKQGLRELMAELKAEIKELRAEMKADINRIDTKQDRMHGDFSQFYRILGEHSTRLDYLEKR